MVGWSWLVMVVVVERSKGERSEEGGLVVRTHTAKK